MCPSLRPRFHESESDGEWPAATTSLSVTRADHASTCLCCIGIYVSNACTNAGKLLGERGRISPGNLRGSRSLPPHTKPQRSQALENREKDPPVQGMPTPEPHKNFHRGCRARMDSVHVLVSGGAAGPRHTCGKERAGRSKRGLGRPANLPKSHTPKSPPNRTPKPIARAAAAGLPREAWVFHELLPFGLFAVREGGAGRGMRFALTAGCSHVSGRRATFLTPAAALACRGSTAARSNFGGCRADPAPPPGGEGEGRLFRSPLAAGLHALRRESGLRAQDAYPGPDGSGPRV